MRRRRANRNRSKAMWTLITTIWLLCCSVLIHTFCGTAHCEPARQTGLTVDFIDVGQGDAALVSCDGYHMLIDGGSDEESYRLTAYLESRGIETLSYVILSHAHRDHAGGLGAAVDHCTVRTALSPVPSVTYEAATFDNFILALSRQGACLLCPSAGTTFFLGSAKCTVLGPITTEGLVAAEQANNTSLIIRIEYGSTSFLFTGDAEWEEEFSVLESGSYLQSDVLKVAHHGAYTSTTEEFLSAVSPQASIISCGAGNEYGHPDQETVDRLTIHGAEIYRTDIMGTITAISDGTNISIITESGEVRNYTGRVPGQAGGKAMPSETTASLLTYVLNTRSLRFHKPNCPSVTEMSANNRSEFTGTREELIGQGYTPCGYCKP